MNNLAKASSFLLMTLAPAVVFAAGLPTSIVTCSGTNIGGGKECTVCDIATTAQNVLNAGIYLLIFLAAVLFAWAGFKMLTAGGDTEGYTAGKRIFVNVLIGLLIILAGWIVIDTLMRTFVNPGSFGPWNKIC